MQPTVLIASNAHPPRILPASLRAKCLIRRQMSRLCPMAAPPILNRLKATATCGTLRDEIPRTVKLSESAPQRHRLHDTSLRRVHENGEHPTGRPHVNVF